MNYSCASTRVEVLVAFWFGLTEGQLERRQEVARSKSAQITQASKSESELEVASR